MRLKNNPPEQPQQLSPNIQRVVELKSVTWNKDSHGLFDYENNFYELKKFQIQCSVEMSRNENTIISDKIDSSKPNTHSVSPILTIQKSLSERDEYYIQNASSASNSDNKCFIIIRALKNRDGRSQRGYRLKDNDTIRFG
jgi:hypothetical protein